MSGLFHDEDHRYFVSARIGDHLIGDPIPLGPLTSVTTALKALDKPAIPRWAARTVAEYAVNDYAAVGSMIAGMGAQATINSIKGVPWHKRDSAGERGTDIHMLTEALDNGHVLTEEQEALPKIRRYRCFLAEWQPQMVGVEQMIVNFSEMYAGTADRFALIDGELWLLDIKTSDIDKSGPYDDHWLQLAGLNGGEWWGWPDKEELEPAQKATRFGILQLADDHYTVWEGRITDAEYQAFLQVKRTYEWLQGPYKSVKIGKAKREIAA